MTPGIEKGPGVPTKEQQKADESKRPEFEGLGDKLEQSTESISRGEAIQRGRQALEAFLESKRDEINQCTDFKLDENASPYDADNYEEETCSQLAREKKKLELLKKEKPKVKKERDNAEPGTVEQKICAAKLTAFENKENELKEEINKLEKQVSEYIK